MEESAPGSRSKRPSRPNSPPRASSLPPRTDIGAGVPRRNTPPAPVYSHPHAGARRTRNVTSRSENVNVPVETTVRPAANVSRAPSRAHSHTSVMPPPVTRTGPPSMRTDSPSLEYVSQPRSIVVGSVRGPESPRPAASQLPRSASRSSQLSLDSKGLAKVSKRWQGVRDRHRRDSIAPSTSLELLSTLQRSATRFRELRNQILDAEDELAGHITGLTILHGSDGHGQNRSEMDSDVELPAGEAAGDEHEVEDELLGYESAPDLEAEMDEQRRWEASRRERLKRAGLSESDIERRRSQPAFESTPRPIGQGGASNAMPRRNVVFDPEEPRYGSISRANAWPDAAAPLTRGLNAAGVTGPTLPPAMPGLRPRRSMAPSAMGGMHYARPDNERDANTAHDVPELAYTGPSPIARDSFGVQRLLDMIEEMVSEEATSPPPAYLKMSKLPLPKSYDGKDNLDEFELWLRGLLEYFHTLRITGDSMDADRLRLLSSSLTDEAALWFYNTVQSTSREKRNWLFSEAVIGLFRRFIHRDNYLYAAQQFEHLKYDASKGGVAALYERLLYISDRMWERPSRYQMRTKFLTPCFYFDNLLPFT